MSGPLGLHLPVSRWKVLGAGLGLISLLLAAGFADSLRRQQQLTELTQQVCTLGISDDLQETLSDLVDSPSLHRSFSRFAAREVQESLAGAGSVELIYQRQDQPWVVSPWSGPVEGLGKYLQPEWGNFSELTLDPTCVGHRNDRFFIVLRAVEVGDGGKVLLVIRQGLSH
ncbi:MAG: hypothetical protein K0U98_08865 [Deltaproteobacteria bacterium]|nr:hypothetical protein [Deltaproteobacteria bacterium]